MKEGPLHIYRLEIQKWILGLPTYLHPPTPGMTPLLVSSLHSKLISHSAFRKHMSSVHFFQALHAFLRFRQVCAPADMWF
jgi:hypothetical protein